MQVHRIGFTITRGLRIRAPVAAQRHTQHFRGSGKRCALVAMLGTANGHDAAARRALQRGRIVGHPAIGILQTRLGQTFALASCARHVATGSHRHADIKQQRVFLPGRPHGQRVGGEYRGQAAKRAHGVLRGRGTREHAQVTRLDHTRQVRRKAGDVLAAAQRCRYHTVFRYPRQRRVHRLTHHPWARQESGVPVEQSTLVDQHRGLTAAAACTFHQPAHVVRHPLHAVGGKAHEIGLQQDFRHHCRTLNGQACGLKQALAEGMKIGVSVTH